MAYVAIFSPDRELQRVELGETNVVGRSRECHVCIKDANVSRMHCKVERIDGRWMLFDLDSTNGTWLDAARVRHYALRDGETFYIGDARLVFHTDKRVENRPEDPHEASRMAEMFSGSDSLSDTILQNRPQRPQLKVRPALNPRATLEKPPRSDQSKPLPFRRPRATPIVKTETGSSGWIRVVLQRFAAQH